MKIFIILLSLVSTFGCDTTEKKSPPKARTSEQLFESYGLTNECIKGVDAICRRKPRGFCTPQERHDLTNSDCYIR